MLHILTKSPFHFDIKLFITMLSSSDDIIVIRDGVILSLKENIYLNKIQKHFVKLYVLQEDSDSRGLLRHHISKKFVIINYTNFIDLTVKNIKSITW